MAHAGRDAGPPAFHRGPEADLPAYLSGPDRAPFPTRPTREVARAGARRLATALADAHAAIVAAPPLPPASGAAAFTQPGGWLPPSTRAPTAITGGFLRMVELPGGQLGAMVDDWWSTASKNGSSTVDHRLRLAKPRRDHLGGVTIAGRFRRFAPWHWTPVVLELWPRHGRWTMITMTPQGGVFATRRYFRSGHAAIERLTRSLAATPAARA